MCQKSATISLPVSACYIVPMLAVVDNHRRQGRGLALKIVVLLVIAAIHGAALQLMLAEAAKVWRVDPPTSPAIATWNILESNEAPPALPVLNPRASVIQVNIDAPKIETEEPAPIAAGLGAAMPIDPYAGASPVKLAAPTLASSTVVRDPELVDPGQPHPPPSLQVEHIDAAPGAKPSALKPVRCEVLAQPSGGFTSARIVQSSGDIVVDRRAVVAVMHHQGLVAAGMVDQPRWLLLTDDELARSLNETR